jgi:hypothetical protein
MRSHSFDQRLSKLTHVRFHWAKLEEIVDFFGAGSVLKITPEMILDGRFPGATTLTHFRSADAKPPLLDFQYGASRRAKLGKGLDHICGGAAGLGATIDTIAETAFLRLRDIVEHEDGIDYRHTMADCNSLKRIGHGADEIVGVIRLAFQNDAARNNGVRSVMRSKLTNHNRNLECARNALEQNFGLGHERTKLGTGVIDQTLDIFAVEATRNDDERALTSAGPDSTRLD